MKINLRTYVAFIFAIIIFALTTVLSITISKYSSNTIKREIGNNLSTTAFNMADKLDSFMWSRIGEIQVLSQIKDINTPEDLQTAQTLLNQLQASIPVFSWIGLTDANGKILVATNRILEGADISMRPVYQEGIKNLFVGDVHNAVLLANLLPNPSGEPLQFVDISVPLVSQNGNKNGVLAAHLSWEWSRQVHEEIVQPLKDELKGAEIFVVSQNDNTVLLGPDDMIGMPLHLDSVRYAREGKNSWLLEEWPDGKRYLSGYGIGNGYQDYNGLGWTVIVRIPEEVAFTPVENLKKSIMAIGTIAAIFFAIIGWLLAGFISKPLQEISTAAHRLRLGHNVKIPYYTRIEDLELLSSSLRELVESLLVSESNLGKMENLAHHDLLTGLGNRVALDHFLKENASIERHKENAFALLYMDLDGFKKVNDTYGHEAGDKLLQLAATRLKNSLRTEDTIFRLGGDEFLVILSSSSRSAEKVAAMVANKLIKKLNEPFLISDIQLEIGCSIGIAIWPNHDLDPFTVIRYADEALYISKKTGKNKYSFRDDLIE